MQVDFDVTASTSLSTSTGCSCRRDSQPAERKFDTAPQSFKPSCRIGKVTPPDFLPAEIGTGLNGQNNQPGCWMDNTRYGPAPPVSALHERLCAQIPIQKQVHPEEGRIAVVIDQE